MCAIEMDIVGQSGGRIMFDLGFVIVYLKKVFVCYLREIDIWKMFVIVLIMKKKKKK